MKTIYRIKNFGTVRPHQSDAMNFHLDIHLKTFDDMYAYNGGILGSASHQFEREQFARSTSESLIECQRNNYGEILDLETIGSHYSSSLGVEFTVVTRTEHGETDKGHDIYYEANLN